jgi:signal transduction histidine kinase
MLSLSFALIIGVAVGAFLLGLITLLNDPRHLTNRAFSALCICSGLYTLANYTADHDQVRALIWVQLTFLFAAATLALLLLFINNFPKRLGSKPREFAVGIIAVIVAIFIFLPGFVSVKLQPNNTEVIPGPLYSVFIAYVVIYLVATYIIYRNNFKLSSSLDKERMRYMMAGFGVTALLLLITNLLLPLFTGNNNLSELGTCFILIFISFSAFAIIRHRLFNIRLLIARSLAYILLLATLGAIYGLAVFGVSSTFFPSNSASKTQLLLNTALAIVLAFTFQPLRRLFEHITDKFFFRNRYDSQVVLNSFSKILVSELDLNRILKKGLAELCENLHIQFGQLVVFNNDRVYRIEHFGPLPKRLMIAPELAKLNHTMLIADEMQSGERKDVLDQHGVRVSMELRTREEFIGYLLLGDKLSGDIYSNQDIELLEIIGKQLAVAILNAKAYAQIKEFNLTLQARIDHATGRLRVANRHLKELDRAKDEFISMASHQLRTPLTTIKGYLSMMLEGDAGRLTKAQKEFVGYAFGSSERMVNLISDLLNVSRLSAGRFLIQTKPTDMVQMVADEVRQLETHATGKGIKLIFETPKQPLPPAQIDENKTRQVIMNFIDNAIYYTQSGEVHVVLDQNPERVRLEVRDSGIGVPEDAKRKLFSKFFRADNAQTVRPDGTGLGLYLAKRVVEDQGGTIIFSSVEGKGSTFGFELPTSPKVATHEDKHGRNK